MKKNIYNKLCLVLLILLSITTIVYLLYTSICMNPSVTIYDSKNSGPTILLVSGTHGNEKAPVIAINEFFKNNNPKTGKVIIIDNVNYCGLFLNDRYLPDLIIGEDNINRNYCKTHENSINKTVTKYIKKADYIFDFHEATDFQYLNFDKLGNSVSTDINIHDCENIVNILNKLHDDVQWVPYIRPKEKLTKGTLFDYCINNNFNYVLIESSVNNNIDLRVKQNETILKYLYEKYLS